MSATVRATGQGEVFRAGDAADYVSAVRAVLDDPQRYRAAYDRPGLLDAWTWQAQAKILDGVYRRLLDPAGPATPADAGSPAAGSPAGGSPAGGSPADRSEAIA
jgi:hypothetical protein